jgi:membrane-bound lytic murein transglycosylase A
LRRQHGWLASFVAVVTAASVPAYAASVSGPGGSELRAVSFDALRGFAQDNLLESFAAFQKSCRALTTPLPPLRQAVPIDPGLLAVCDRAQRQPPRTRHQARVFFEQNFRAFEIVPPPEPGKFENFVTGYYEPVVDGSTVASRKFTGAVLSRPDDLVAVTDANRPEGFVAGLALARRNSDGTLVPYPDRGAIERGALAGHAAPIVWLRDSVEVFFVQIQGSARVRLQDGRSMRLVYDGRNGRAYSSIGQWLVKTGTLPADQLSLARLKQWIREQGTAEGEAGCDLMRRNESYIFFRMEPDSAAHGGPTGGAGVALTRLRSIAIDRRNWAYGLPFWLEANLPWQQQKSTPFRRLMIAQDTGTAIVGTARADIFFGTGKAAGEHAGNIRHSARFVVLLPNPAVPSL